MPGTLTVRARHPDWKCQAPCLCEGARLLASLPWLAQQDKGWPPTQGLQGTESIVSQDRGSDGHLSPVGSFQNEHPRHYSPLCLRTGGGRLICRIGPASLASPEGAPKQTGHGCANLCLGAGGSGNRATGCTERNRGEGMKWVRCGRRRITGQRSSDGGSEHLLQGRADGALRPSFFQRSQGNGNRGRSRAQNRGRDWRRDR